MAMKKIERNNFGDELRAKLENKGDAIEGYYQGSEQFEHKGKTVTKHRFKNEEGKIVSLLGSHQLNEDLPKVPAGAFTRVTFTGKSPTKSGNRVNNYEIEYEESSL